MVEPSAQLAALERMLASGRETALLRFGLGSAHLARGDAAVAADHLRRAVELDRDYSAAWKLLGKALEAADRHEDALTAYRDGIAAAGRKGDKQALREMEVFARRLERRKA
jgi:Flp pilus assembly protein TadD